MLKMFFVGIGSIISLIIGFVLLGLIAIVVYASRITKLKNDPLLDAHESYIYIN